ncbi:hypothetical protein CXZ10_05820 [Pleomorphomonas diazotrophica]|uniref:Uncharacterized protein n=1 Tax=Pleomorphomonas diazotrophica TaxID=1166257 RepID=A0A1I4Q8G1_9HYPH|nr:hypothetical protein [Pleomorphomonas diazotrophica]PKR90866.1 hypothetical protein CXZ10_05820 [Pleomorphomonas diazotrophica]SFM36344.1 hypothetical protein SAMN05192571_101148 [Pleomorphomonas diazotrophica]
MTIPTWPASLPKPERDSWSQSPFEARRKRQTEGLPPAFSRRFSGVPETVALSIVVSRAGRAVFDQFYKEDTSFGAKPFYMPDPTTDGWALLDGAGNPMLTEGGQPILLSAQWLVFFGDDLPKQTIEGVRFRLAFSVMVMP